MNRLWFKLAGTISLIVILGSSAIYISMQLLTRQRYEQMVFAGDADAAKKLAEVLPFFYVEAGSWEGVGELFLFPMPMFRNDNMEGIEPGRGMMGQEMGPGMMRRMERRPGGTPMGRSILAVRIVVTNSDRSVVFDTWGELKGFFPPDRHSAKGESVLLDGKNIGYVFVGTMIEPALNPGDRDFLSALNRAILLISLGIVGITLIIGSLLVLHIMSPVRVLIAASSKVAAGDFAIRVPADRKDELGLLSNRFNKMAESLENADQSRKRLIADSAHELRTPVSLIQGKLEMILDGVYKADRKHLQEVMEETKHLSRLIADLQELADADAGVLNLDFEETDLRELIGQAAAMYRPQTDGKDISIDMDICKEPVVVLGDKRRLYQVLTNLLSNSLRHTDEGGRMFLSLENTGIARNQVIRISIGNSGPPIPDDKIEAIFDRFYRLDSARNRKHGGKGLGLAISKAIVEAHNGKIRAENLETGGVRFVIILPTQTASANL